MLASSLKERVRSGKLTYGPMLTYDFWPGYLEVFKAEGMHYAVLDLEHGAATLKEVEELCCAGRMLDFPLLIRPEGSIFHLVRKYLDMGAAGFLLPATIEASSNGSREQAHDEPYHSGDFGGVARIWKRAIARKNSTPVMRWTAG